MKIEVTGAVPWGKDSLTTEALPNLICGSMMLVCSPIFENGELVRLDFPLVEYCFIGQTSPKTGKSVISAVSREVGKEKEFPHWPEPEPNG